MRRLRRPTWGEIAALGEFEQQAAAFIGVELEGQALPRAQAPAAFGDVVGKLGGPARPLHDP